MILTFREEELSYKQFTQLTRSDKNQYLLLLSGIDEDKLSYNDKMILQNFTTRKNTSTNNFFRLNDDYEY
jgi:hypothetical protein